MAQPQKIDFNGTMIELTWATEEVQREILKTLKKTKAGTSPAEKKKSEETKKATKNIEKFGKGIGKTSSDLKKINITAGKVISEFDKLESSASSVSSGFAGLLGATGALGSVLGFAASTFDSFIDIQVSAIQSGFSFSDQLIETRTRLATIGMNFSQLSAIIADQGESIINLGSTGATAAEQFTDMVFAAREATKGMGYYGLSSEEIANELADLTGTLVKAGHTGEELFSGAVDSFSLLNREVLGYARLTGQNRRELMRNRGAIDDDALYLSTISKMGPAAVAAGNNMTDALTGAFGDAAPTMIDAVKAMVVNAETDIQTMQPELIAALNTSGLMPMFAALAKNIGSGSNDLAGVMTENTAITARISATMADNEELIRNNYVRFRRADNPLAGFYEQLLTGIVHGRTFSTNTEDMTSAVRRMHAELEPTTEKLLTFKQELDKLINTTRAGILQIFGMDDYDSLDSLNIDDLSDSVNGLVGNINAFKNMIDFGPNGFAAGTIIAGIAGLFAAPTVIGAMVTGIAGLFAFGGIKGGAGVAGAAGVGAAGAGLGAILKKALLPIAIVVGARTGFTDEEYKDAGISGYKRIQAGIDGMFLSGLDMAANLANSAVEATTGVDFGTANLSGWLRDSLLNEAEAQKPRPVPAFDPTISTPSHYVPETLQGIVKGAQLDEAGNISRTNSPNPALPGNYKAVATEMDLFKFGTIKEIKETNRLIRQLINSFENN